MEQNHVHGMFIHAVRSGNRAEWQRLLEECRPDIGQCLLDAVRERSHEAIRDVLQYRPPLNVEDRQGQRPIHLAARSGTPAIISLLASAGCTVNGSNAEGWTPLHIACQYGMSAVAEELISCGASVNAARTENKLTPLHVAVQMNQEYMIRVLFNHFANPNVRSSVSHGQVSPLCMAVENCEKHGALLLETFLEAASRNYEIEYGIANGSFPLHRAVEMGDVRTCQLLLMYFPHMKPVIEDQLRRELQEADAQNTNKEKLILNLRDEKGRTALHLAIMNSRREIVEMLLNAGCDTEQLLERNMLPLELAMRSVSILRTDHHVETGGMEQPTEDGVGWGDAIVHLLVDRGINLHVVSAQGDYPIHMALSAALFHVALKIMKVTPHKINVTNLTGETPLHIACRVPAHRFEHHARIKLIHLLLSMGLSVNALSVTSACPLSNAVRLQDAEVVDILLRCQADMTIPDNTEHTPLHYASRCQNLAILETMLNARPDAVFLKFRGPSLVNAAVSTMNLQSVQCLLDRQADPNIADPRNGCPPLHSVIKDLVKELYRSDCVRMVELLVRGGANLDTLSQSGLTALQTLVHTLICLSALPNGKELASTTGLTIFKILVEAGSRLEPWELLNSGIQRHPPFQCMAFCGLLSCVYYLANVGWPLHTEIPAPTSTWAAGGSGQRRPQNWATLPGNTPEQDNLHAYLMLRNANPFSLLHLVRAKIRTILMEKILETYGGQRREVLTSIDTLPLPDVIRKFLKFQDADYSSVENCWEKLLHLLPKAATEEAIKAGLTS